jgi:hypothetical protein
MEIKPNFVIEANLVNLSLNCIEQFKEKENWTNWFNLNESKFKNYCAENNDGKTIVIIAITKTNCDLVKKISKQNINVMYFWTNLTSELWAIKAESKATLKPILLSNRIELDIESMKNSSPPTFKVFSHSKVFKFELKNDGNYVLGFSFDRESRLTKIEWNLNLNGKKDIEDIKTLDTFFYSKIYFADANSLQRAIVYTFKELKIMVMSDQTSDAVKFLYSPYQNDLRKYDDNFRFCIRSSSVNPEKSLVIVHFSLTDKKYRLYKKWDIMGSKVNEEKLEIKVAEGKAFYEKKVGQNVLRFYNPDEFLSYLTYQFHEDLTNQRRN